jgi:hypothetical protein
VAQVHPFAVAAAVPTAQDDFTARRAKVARHGWNGGAFALFGITERDISLRVEVKKRPAGHSARRFSLVF